MRTFRCSGRLGWGVAQGVCLRGSDWGVCLARVCVCPRGSVHLQTQRQAPSLDPEADSPLPPLIEFLLVKTLPFRNYCCER